MELELNEGEIKQQVSRILDTRSFRNSNILSRFLYYIITETLEGNEKSLKEYVIATNVLKRTPDFDPQLDAVVRIHARRLRNLLEDYYVDEGKHDPIRISIPKGRYIPVFEINSSTKRGKSNGPEDNELTVVAKPSIGIIPFMHVNHDERNDVICSVLCQDLAVELTRFDEISVVSDYLINIAMGSLKNFDQLSKKLNIDYLITLACVVGEDQVKVTVELHSVVKEQILWAESFYFEDYKLNNISNYSTLVRKVVGMVGGFLGVVYRDSLRSKMPRDYDHMYAIYWHNHYHKNFSMEAYHQTLQAVNRGLGKNPESSLLLSLKGQLYLDQIAMDSRGDFDFYNEGLKLVLKALDLDPNNQHAWQIYAWANLLNHDKEKFVSSAKRCIAINPNNAMFASSIGFGYECAGEYETGLELMSESIELNPYYFWVTNIGFCLYYLSHKEFDEAYVWAGKINREALLWDPLLRACCLGHLGKENEASQAVMDLMKLTPDFPERSKAIVNLYLLDKNLQDIIIEGLIMSGIDFKD